LPSIASGSSVDEYIEQSNIQTIDADAVANQAKASRERYFAEKENSTMDWDMPSSLSGSGSTPSESRIMTREQSSADVQDFSRQPSEISTDAQVESNESVMANASGTWSLRLTDSIQRDVSLSLFQEGASIFGSGSLRENNSTNQVMASGTLQGDLLSLDLTTQQPITLYKLLLNMSNDDASGKYSAISSGGDKWTGQVDGFRLAA
ncbi:MAG: hypothetical protein LUQ44_05155, partial [Methanothrix sp.]|nr:hypothetical protein [Methanothrix sp.]